MTTALINKHPLTIDGIADLAEDLPDDAWYMVRIVFRKIEGGAEVRVDPTIHRCGFIPEERGEKDADTKMASA